MLALTDAGAPPGWALAAVALLSFIVADAWRRWALRRGVLDVPGHRSSHVVATPRGAGIGIVVAVLVAALGASPPPAGVVAAALSVGFAGLLGLVDDLRPLSPGLKFAGQAFAGLPVALAFPMPLDGLMPFLPTFVGMAASWAVVLLFVNAWNFMDGIDGLAAVAATVVGLVAWVSIGAAPLALLLAMTTAAACVGFLPLNAPRARAFMGDCGSHALGMMVAILLLAADGAGGRLPILAACAPFLVDVLGTLAKRARAGEPLASAHRRHLYQLATRCGYSHARVTMAYAAWMLASGGGVAMVQSAGMGGWAAGVSVAATAVAWWRLQASFEGRLAAGPAA